MSGFSAALQIDFVGPASDLVVVRRVRGRNTGDAIVVFPELNASVLPSVSRHVWLLPTFAGARSVNACRGTQIFENPWRNALYIKAGLHPMNEPEPKQFRGGK